MKLRTARKIVKAVGTPDGGRYNQYQIHQACDRVDRTASAREDRRYWEYLISRHRSVLLSNPDPSA